MKGKVGETKRREKLEMIFNYPVKGETYFHGPSYKWKQVVFQHYSKIIQKEMTVEELIIILQRENVHFTQSSSLVTYPIIEFIKLIAKYYKETIEN
ncbi:hypothetical protein [Bacillus sp. AY2-1]|uniref:hypothetical protein n=1 Tax=Bacillus sp. AY2-1 TaxID=2217828 RepID=UPI0011EE7F85|nr:hypothetical protein [Bacillus sp. AY2-1]KAA0806748.1 hypothetical protein DN403_29550 [Bacillus sp. AY2-1]